MGGSSKSTSTSGPAASTLPFVQGALSANQSTYNQQQPSLDAYGTLAGLGGAALSQKAFQTSPFIDNAQGANRAISNGAFLGNNPGQSTYQGLMSGGANPGDQFASKVAQGQYLNNQPSAGVYSNLLSSQYLQGNPYLNNIIGQTNQNVETQAARQFGARGMGAGISSPYADVLSKNLANNEGQLRYQNYTDASNRQLQAAGQSDAAFGAERGRMDSAAGLLSSNYNAGQDRALGAAQASDSQRNSQVSQMLQALGLAPGLEQAQYAGVDPTLAALQSGATLPLLGLDQYSNAIANLTGATNTSTSTSKGPGLLNTVAGGLASGVGSALVAKSERRLKTNIEKVGQLEDGLNVYDYDYIWGGPRQRGVMVDEVEKLRPWALGPITPEGYRTVDYSKLEMA